MRPSRYVWCAAGCRSVKTAQYRLPTTRATDKMHCHYCGVKTAVMHTCAACGSNRLQSKSFGTEKIEEEVQLLFPEARVARMDVDSMRGKKSMETLLAQIEKHKIDILVGTQMVVKGLDFASVTVVGILSADSLLAYPDFRVNERAFQLMEQVSGRAGRADGEGKVLIQAYNVHHPVLKWVQQHDIKTFYAHEIQYRAHFAYPPYTRLIKIMLRHVEEAKTVQAAEQIASALKTLEGIQVQGPGPAIIPRVRNRYIQEVWIKCPPHGAVLDSIKAFLYGQKQAITAAKGNSGVQVIFDVDPV